MSFWQLIAHNFLRTRSGPVFFSVGKELRIAISGDPQLRIRPFAKICDRNCESKRKKIRNL